MTLRRVDLLEGLAELRNGEPMVISPGLANYPIAANADHPMTIYNMELSYAASTALGVALAWPSKKVVAIEGDGSMLAATGLLPTIARYNPPNLMVLVLDNGVYRTTGTGMSLTATSTGTDIEKLAIAAGMTKTTTVSDLETAKDAVRRALEEPGPWLVVAKVDNQVAESRGELPATVIESALRFRRAAREEIRAAQEQA